MRSLFLLLVVAFLSAACQDVTGPTILFDQQFELAPGQAGHIANTQRRIAFDGVDGDSRCPANAICVWGGDAKVKIRVIDGATTTPYELHTGSMEPVTHQEMTITLVNLSPYPFSSSPIKPEDYRATLKVSE